MFDHFSSGGPNGPTKREQIKSCLMEIDITEDGGRHVLRANTLLLRAVACAKGSRSYSLVPFLPVPQGRTGFKEITYMHSKYYIRRLHIS